LLVVDAGAMARSAAAIVHGYATFDPELRVAGVILNRVGSPTHEKMLREAIEPLNIPILGVLRRDANLNTPDRHLGLVPAAERREEARKALDRTGEEIARSCDLDGILRLAASAEPLQAKPWDPALPESETTETASVRVAVASGPAFSFVYRENLELLRGAGAEIVFFDPTTEEDLPEGTDALYLGGGFPETYAEALSENDPLRDKVRAFALSSRPVAAECGGLLYLCRELDGKKMCGVLDASARMTDRLSLGYREACSLVDSPLARRGDTLRGHEFHYSAVEPQAGALPGAAPAWELSGRGEEGFVAGGVHASYLHTHWASTPEVPRRFVYNAAWSRTESCVARHSTGVRA
jgi:cobyrinic acid a,c-diamide synthase